MNLSKLNDVAEIICDVIDDVDMLMRLFAR